MLCYAAIAKDKKVLMASTSGGVFFELGKRIIQEGGCVFGCVLRQPDLKAVHCKAETLQELAQMHGPKYVQSNLGSTLRQCEEALDSGKRVLFSGTPCQILAVRKLLGTNINADKLLLVDIICHGTPSVELFDLYKKDLEEDLGGRIESFSFRAKKDSWSKGRLIATSCSKSIDIPYGESPYIMGFMTGLTLRDSCYKCMAKGGKSLSDITLGDCWGIDRIKPELYDDRGCSLVIVHSPIGEQSVAAISNEVDFVSIDRDVALSFNKNFVESTTIHKGRMKFLRNLERMGFSESVKNSLRPSLLMRVRNLLRGIIAK